MAIRIAFCGEKCFDLIHYISRILYKLGKSTLLVDLSPQNDRSLEKSINIPPGMIQGHTVDNKGVRFAPHYYKKYDNEYKYIIFYYGSGVATKALNADWKFMICNSYIESVENAENFLLHNNSQIATSISNSSDSCYYKGEPIVLYLDVSTERKGYIRSKLSVSDSNFSACELEVRDIENKINIQYESTFKFNKLSLDYKELLIKCVSSICSQTSDKELLKAIKEAERGK